MKRLLPFIALCFAAVSFTHAQVTSVNAVGMVKANVKGGGLTFLTTPFNSTDTSIDSVIGDQLTGGLSAGQSDRIIAWDSDTSAYAAYWKVTGSGDPAFDGKWFIDDGSFPPTPAEINLSPGDGFWVQSRQAEDQDLILSGEVPDAAIQVSIPVGLSQIGFPYPVSISVNDSGFGITSMATGGLSAGQSDRLIFWNPDTQSYTALWLVEGSGDPTFDGFWHIDDGAFPPTQANVTVEPGIGFWYQRRDASPDNWSPVKPYVWP